MQPGPAAPPPKLPDLRQELRIERGAAEPGGAVSWLIIDPVQHRYLQIDDTAYQLLSRWSVEIAAADLSHIMERDFGIVVSHDDIAQFVKFLADHNLTIEPADGRWQHFSEVSDRARHGWFMWLVHNYLYFKIPLLRPEPMLRRIVPWLEPLYTRTFTILIAAIGLAGLYLVSRQWSVFLSTFQNFFSWDGALTYGAALILVKSAHELGHAVTAARYGCRVPSMGVCFLVMFPVLYTDVTDAWRLMDRNKRLAIGAAGIAVELSLACIATLLWTFLPDGPLRSVMFSIATVGWVLSLAINLNPLMRFDGYYLFGDAIGIDNLQSRSFALGRWRMREVLFGLGTAPPESLPSGKQRILIWYAWIVWVYRLVLFTGIAVLVYYMAFKALGIILFLVEIIYFIVKPIGSEVLSWWTDGVSIRAGRRTTRTVCAAIAVLVLFFVPLSTRMTMPAVIEAGNIAWVYPQHAGEVAEVRVKSGDPVDAGDILAILKSPELDHQAAVTARNLALVRMRLARRASDSQDRAQSLSLEHEAVSLAAALSGLKKEADQLVIKAPIAGIVSEFNSEIHKGRAIGRSELIALISGRGARVVRGYLDEHQVRRLGDRPIGGTFLVEAPGFGRIPVAMDSVAKSSAPKIDIPELASVHGGVIAVRPQGGNNNVQLVPTTSMYLATLRIEGGAEVPTFSARGTVDVEGDRSSLASRAFRQIAAVLIRESGF